MSLLEIIKEETNSIGMVQIPFLIERLTISTCCHILNLSNLDNPRFFHAGSIENSRFHIIFMISSGFGKSASFRLFLNPKRSYLSSADGILTSVRSTFSPESWMGTVNESSRTKGIFNRFKRGIVGADEFMRLKTLAEQEVATNEEVYLLSALDSDTAIKDLASGYIEEEGIGTTLWAGMRICKLDTASGLMRRFGFQLTFPTPSMAKEFKKAIRKKDIKKKLHDNTLNKIKDEIETIWNKVEEIDEIDYKEVEDFLNGSMAVPHFEENIYKRIAVGYSIATDTFPEVKVDDFLKELLRNEEWGRKAVRGYPEKEMLYQIIKNEPEPMTKEELIEFVKTYYMMSLGNIRAAWRANVGPSGLLRVKDGVVIVLDKKIPEKYRMH